MYGEKCNIFIDHQSLNCLQSQKEFNLRQRWWFEMIKDCDSTIEYHPGKANVVADALSRKSSNIVAHLKVVTIPLLVELRGLRAQLTVDELGGCFAQLRIRPTLYDRVNAKIVQ